MPKYTAHCCPVCRGKGEILDDIAQTGAPAKYTLATGNIYACHVCMGSCFLWHSELTEAEARGEKEPEEQPLINPGISPYRPLGVPPYPQQPFIYSGTSISTSGPLNPTQPNKIVIDGKEIDLSELKAWNKAPMSWSINYQSVQP